MHSEPITPKHDPPKVAGGDLPSFADDRVRQFFADFAELADVTNWWLSDEDFGSRWRLQELPESDVRLNVSFSGGPILGRCYDVFHNQVRLGRLEIRPGYEYSAAAPTVTTEIELDMVRLLTFDNISEFINVIAMHVCAKNPTGSEYDASQAIFGALIKALWDSQTMTKYKDLDAPGWGELEFHLQGSASEWYFSRRELIQEQRAKRGIIPQR